MDETWNVHVDGNSIFAKWFYPPINQVAELGAYFKKYIVYNSNTAIPGQNWLEMTSAISDTKEAYRSSAKRNLLVVGETTNSSDKRYLYSPEQIIDQAKAYIQKVKSDGQNWEVILVGTIPRADFDRVEDNIAFNARLISVDNYMREHYKEMGADYFIDVREKSPEWFTLRSDKYTAKFMDSLNTCNSYDKINADMVHPINVARDAFANAILYGLKEYINA